MSSGVANLDLSPFAPGSPASSERPFCAERTPDDGFRLWSLSFSGSVRTSRRYHFLLPSELEADLKSYARQRGRSLADVIRSLAVIGLIAERDETPLAQADTPGTLAALTAAEHAVLMVASVLPEGERRMHSLASRASEAAEERLALFRQPREEERL